MNKTIVRLRLEGELAESVAAWCARRGFPIDAYTIPGEAIPVFFLNVICPRPYLKKLRRLLGDDRVVGWGVVR